ncbi:helix-turn-helix domain-containing protein [Canibacter zhoujuaniae]|uniref:helix-turn-helix domain-containing protein n=1 Tax=Canibacter zhoujuaniae TaxID=2708343 RepID=UPI00142464C3|nr:helix-turn-helix transcriptional regulator [Canibacter zhoujuaniae]
MSLAAEVKVLALRSGKTLKEAAEHMGIARVTLYKKLRGLSPLTVDDLQELGAFFETEPLELYRHRLEEKKTPAALATGDGN